MKFITDANAKKHFSLLHEYLFQKEMFIRNSNSGIMNYMMKSDGSFYRMLIAPICRSSIILGQLLEAVLNAIVLPIFFLSTALFPRYGINGILSIAININPFTYVINALRSLILQGSIEVNNLIFVLVLFIIMGSISFTWALHRLKKETSL